MVFIGDSFGAGWLDVLRDGDDLSWYRTLVARKEQQRQPRTPEIYLSVDVEADGPIPGPYSMLSFGIAAFSIDKVLLGTFSRTSSCCRARRSTRA